MEVVGGNERGGRGAAGSRSDYMDVFVTFVCCIYCFYNCDFNVCVFIYICAYAHKYSVSCIVTKCRIFGFVFVSPLISNFSIFNQFA